MIDDIGLRSRIMCFFNFGFFCNISSFTNKNYRTIFEIMKYICILHSIMLLNKIHYDPVRHLARNVFVSNQPAPLSIFWVLNFGFRTCRVQIRTRLFFQHKTRPKSLFKRFFHQSKRLVLSRRRPTPLSFLLPKKVLQAIRFCPMLV